MHSQIHMQTSMHIYICNTILQVFSYHVLVRIKPYKSPYRPSVNGKNCLLWGFKSHYDKNQNEK